MAMLEGVVQDDGFYSGISQFQQLLNAVTTVFVYRYPCIGEFIFNLIRLVTYLPYIALVIGQYIASAFTLVTPTEVATFTPFFVIALSDIRYVASCQFRPQQGCPRILLERQNSLTGASPSQRVYFASIPLFHKAMIGDIANDIS